jgi:hypothetical protein
MSQRHFAFFRLFIFESDLCGRNDAQGVPHLILDEAEIRLLIANRHVPQHRFGLVSRLFDRFGATSHSIDHTALLAAHRKKLKYVNHGSPHLCGASIASSNATGEAGAGR